MPNWRCYHTWVVAYAAVVAVVPCGPVPKSAMQAATHLEAKESLHAEFATMLKDALTQVRRQLEEEYNISCCAS